MANSETAFLFMSVIMYRLKKNGRAALVVADRFLFGLEFASIIDRRYNIMTPEQLKASILQYAIQGKLVEAKSRGRNNCNSTIGL